MTTTKTIKDNVELLINKAANTNGALDAMQLSQAAVNAANAARVLVDIDKVDPDNVTKTR